MGALVVLVAVQLLVMGLYLPPVLVWSLMPPPAPNDNLTASPNGRVIWLAAGRVDGAGGCPAISAGIVSPAPGPDDHLAAGPNCGVTSLAAGRVGEGGGCPLIRDRLDLSAGVQNFIADAAEIPSAPNNHDMAVPHRRVKISAVGTLVVLVAVQVSVPGLYLPPVSKTLPKRSDPPQTII